MPLLLDQICKSHQCARDWIGFSIQTGAFLLSSLQEVLPRCTSDHWPIVLDTNPFKWGPTPFRFENMCCNIQVSKSALVVGGENLMEMGGKVIAKVLSRRLRGVLHETIHSTQGVFVQGRQILDAVLIANEIVDEKRRSGEEGVVFKIDFEKAYDHVKWICGSRVGEEGV
ncbi:hypothetical protein CK203_027315 [Vitis vinifera]|uniref:Uncharacterized protein n=1 Tax=Vitis vinifera TaxID=29760 RepID=A0A438J9G7_VITVI|nr:hypothetical protein CK203_027315 [Vitis vinifera]